MTAVWSINLSAPNSRRNKVAMKVAMLYATMLASAIGDDDVGTEQRQVARYLVLERVC